MSDQISSGANDVFSPKLADSPVQSTNSSDCTFIQKIVAEILATYFLMFVGRAAIIVNADHRKVVTLPGIAIVWGLAVTVMIYVVGHISGAHLNPAVTISFASCKRFPWKQVPAYAFAQVIGATLANITLWLLFHGKDNHFTGIPPTGTDIQALVMEFTITFYLMFVALAVVTDDRAIGDMAGLAIGATVLLCVMIAGPISGGVMNPAGALGLSIVTNEYKQLWIYIVGPTVGAVSGTWAYNIIRAKKKPAYEITKSASFSLA